MSIDRAQALAYRVAGQNLHERTDPLTAVAACGLQEAPPGWWGVALHARAVGEPDPADIVLVNAMRGAPYVVPVSDARVFTEALVPGDAGLKTLVGSDGVREAAEGGLGVREALDLVADAAREGLAAAPLERDDFHQALRERLPGALLPWCRGCQSNHVRPGYWRTLGLLGVTWMPAKATYALAEPSTMPLEQARAELVRRFLRCFGPATPPQLAAWAQTAPAHARSLFDSMQDELEEVELEGRPTFVLAEDRQRLEHPPAARGLRMLGGYDAYVGQPDRDTLVPDAALRKRMFPPVARPGVVLRDGVLAGLWTGRKRKEVLDVELHWLGEPADVEAEAQAVARLRECESVRVLSSQP
jgi:Winged helix DNA-binding domain